MKKREFLMFNRNLLQVDDQRRSSLLPGRWRVGRFVHPLLLALLFLSPCSVGSAPQAGQQSGEAITLAALPTGIGRGYPMVQIDKAVQANAGLQEGEDAPNFQLLLDDGRRLGLQALRGQPVLINFWATWCSPCRLEMPEIVKVATTHPDLVVLAVNVQERPEQIQPFAEEFQMTLPVVRDTDGALRNLYEVRGMPTSVFIDREGKIFTIWTGILTGKLLQDLLTEMGKA